MYDFKNILRPMYRQCDLWKNIFQCFPWGFCVKIGKVVLHFSTFLWELSTFETFLGGHLGFFFSINQYMFKKESIDYFEKIISTKGQIISKCLFGVFNFFQKMNKNTHCSRITRYHSFISQDFFHFSSFIHNGDNLNM